MNLSHGRYLTHKHFHNEPEKGREDKVGCDYKGASG